MRVFIRSGPKNGVTGKVTVGPPPLGTVPGLGPINASGSGDRPYRGVAPRTASVRIPGANSPYHQESARGPGTPIWEITHVRLRSRENGNDNAVATLYRIPL